MATMPAKTGVHEDAARDPDGYWAAQAEQLPWLRRWDTVFAHDFPTFRWFVGGETNLGHNCLDHQVAQGHAAKTALVYANERGERARYTYGELASAVEQAGRALRGLGVGRGDRITLYMPTCPEAIVAMLAAVRIGAIHSVVFAGFGARALADRVQASGSRLVLTADVTYRKGKDVRLKPIVDEALELGEHDVEHVVVLRRGAEDVSLSSGRDLSWSDFLARAGGDPGFVPLEANEPAFILATSGTTAKPKLAVHTHGGYQVGVDSAARVCFGMRSDDVWW